MAKVIDNTKNLGQIQLLPLEQLVAGNPDLNGLFLGEIYNAFAKPFNENEKVGYFKIINKLLSADQECKDKLPVDPDSNKIFKKLKDGQLLFQINQYCIP